jgi:thiol:disulfide interchange protein DsbD
VYEGTISITATGQIAENAPLGEITLSGELDYQACNDESCSMPQSAPFEATVDVVPANEKAKEINQGIFEKTAGFSVHEKEAMETMEGGMFYALWTFFFFGLGLNLTPCVYPVIPMTVSFFSSQGKQKKLQSLLLAALYVIGIALVFSILGLISGLAGKQWGFLFQSPWFVIGVAVIILAMSASMFGAFEITVPTFLMQLGGKSRQGAVGAMIMGLTVGVVIAPCAAGIVLGLVGIIAKLGMVWKGALFFFVLGIGLGFPYLFLAMFSNLMSRMPKSGMWMVWVRKLFGILLLGVALYFLVPQSNQATNQQGFYLGVLAIFGGLFLGFLDSSEGYSRTFRIVRWVLGGMILLTGIAMVHGALKPPAKGVSWVHSLEDFRSQKKPLLIDFYADWCAACKELDRKTFSNEKVVAVSKQFLMVKVDLTSPTSMNSFMRKKFNVTGLPTVVFVGMDGTERKQLRIVGFTGPGEMIKKMEVVLNDKTPAPKVGPFFWEK